MKSISRKQCYTCKNWKPFSEFYSRKASRDGLRSSCKECSKGESKEFNLKNKDKINLKQRIKYWLNPEKSREIRRHQRQKDLEKNRERIRTWRKNNPEKAKKSETISKDKSRERRLEYAKQYRKSNPEKRRLWQFNRKARARGNGKGTITEKDWQELLNRYGHRCLYPNCNRTDVTKDHVIPLSKGGTNTIDNIQPLCHIHNSKKHTKVIDYR